MSAVDMLIGSRLPPLAIALLISTRLELDAIEVLAPSSWWLGCARDEARDRPRASSFSGAEAVATTGARVFSGTSLAPLGDLEGLAAVMVRPPKPPNPKRETAAVARLANEELRFDEDRADDMMELVALFGGDEADEAAVPIVREEMDVGSAAIVADDEDVEMGANAFLVISGEAFTLAVVDSATRGNSFPFPLNETRAQFPRSFGTDCETVAG